MRERIAKAISGSGAVSAASLRKADAVLDELMRPSDAMIDALIDPETPFIARRLMDKSGHEVIKQTNDDWRECMSNDHERVGLFNRSDEASEFKNRCDAKFKFIAAINEAKGEIE